MRTLFTGFAISLLLTGAALAQTADPGSQVAPAAVGEGTSTQTVEAAKGAVTVTVTSGGNVDVESDAGTATAAGTAGVSVNGVGVSIGGGANVGPDGGTPSVPQTPGTKLPGIPNGPAGPNGPNGPGTAGTGQGQGTGGASKPNGGGGLVVQSASAGGADATCSSSYNVEGEAATGPDILAITADSRLSLVLVCDGDSEVTTSQRDALEANPLLARTLAAYGVDVADIIAVTLPGEGQMFLYAEQGE